MSRPLASGANAVILCIYIYIYIKIYAIVYIQRGMYENASIYEGFKGLCSKNKSRYKLISKRIV